MKKIPDNFTPTEQSYINLAKHGVLKDFIDDQLPAFITYWTETQKKKCSWQMTLQTWMRRSHQGKAGREWEENRHIRNRYVSKPKDDLFEQVLDSINGGASLLGDGGNSRDLPTITRRCRPIPDLPPMTFAQAQAELKKMKII